MTSLSEQLSAVRKSQWEAQLDAFRTFGTRALDSAEQLIVLNLKTSRASVEQATETFRHLLEASNSHDLFALGSTAQNQWQQFFAYGRELMGIATGTRVRTWSTQPAPSLPSPLQIVPAPTANVPTSVPQVLEQAAIATAEATTVHGELARAAVDTGSALAEAALDAGQQAVGRTAQAAQDTAQATAQAVERTAQAAQDTAQTTAQAATQAAAAAPVPAAPTELQAETAHATPAESPAAPAPVISAETLEEVVAVAPPAPAPDPVETAIADDVPPAKETPLAKALNDVAPKPASAEHPIASTVPLEAGPDVELPPVAPVDSTPPLRVATQGPRTPRAPRKK
jgi:Phasin protein